MKNKMIKGVWIDADTQSITPKSIKNDLNGYYDLLKCSMIERVAITGKVDMIIDEEGMYRQDKGFNWGGYQYFGSAFIVESNLDTGDWVDLTEPDKFKSMIEDRVSFW